MNSVPTTSITISLLCLVIILATPPLTFAQDNANARAQIEQLFNSQKPKQAIVLLQQEAFAGAPWAQVWMGTLHQQGRLVPKSLVHSVDWYAQAAAGGSVEAQMRLASLFCNARIKSILNPAKCTHWLAKASAQQHPPAQLQLARMRHNNRFGLGDLSLAAQLAKAAEGAKDKALASEAKALSAKIQADLKTVDKKSINLTKNELDKRLKRDTHTIRVGVFPTQFAATQFIVQTSLKKLYLYKTQRFYVVSYDSFRSESAALKKLQSINKNNEFSKAAVIGWQTVAENLVE